MWSDQSVGTWWLPEDPETKRSGSLFVDPEGRMRLNTIGAFDGVMSPPKGPYPLILGVSTDGELITLWDSQQVKVQTHGRGFPLSTSAEHRVRAAFVGHHFERQEELNFRTISLEYPYLALWTGFRGFSKEWQRDDRGHPERAEYCYEFPDELSVRLEDAEISLHYSFHQTGDLRNEVNLAQKTSLSIDLDEPQLFKILWTEYQAKVRNYLTFAIGVPIVPESIYVTSDAVLREVGDQQRPKKVEVRFPLSPAPPHKEPKHRLDMLFHLHDIREDFEDSMNSWFQRYDELAPVFDLYFGVRYQPDAHLEYQLLALAQALEVLHRRLLGGHYIDDEDFQELRLALHEQLPSDLDSNVKNVFRGKLQYLNEYSLRKRLKHLWDESQPATSVLIPDRNEFVGKLVDTRHYLTHFNPDLENRTADGRELYLLIQQARFLLEIHLMLELGFESSLVHDLASRNSRYKRIRKLAES